MDNIYYATHVTQKFSCGHDTDSCSYGSSKTRKSVQEDTTCI